MKGISETILTIIMGLIILVIAIIFFPQFFSKILDLVAKGSWTVFCGLANAFCKSAPIAAFICHALGCM
jgi:hypothetical protein